MRSAKRTPLMEKVRADLAAGREPTMKELGEALIDAGIANSSKKVAFLKAIQARKRAAKILGDLPSDPDEVRRMLRLAARMHKEWMLGERGA